MTKRGIVESISASRVGHYLREAEIKPHKTKYWLNTKEKDPERFQQQVKEVCDCYHEAPEFHRQKRPTHTVSVDEMTGIQALERVADTLPMQPGYVERREFEYKRHGTQTLIGNFHVVTGEMISPSGNFVSQEALRDRLLWFIEYFNKTMAKPFDWTFTGNILQSGRKQRFHKSTFQ
ncbi:Potassium efflux system KefA protein / Small-conductance mechanosensitive channel [hydrothermal vent metagenome]|uniref:Potassium efflux system KefA protein / Small-conductance mechanosensitive channel n=1 Tax=hydrothermal vent metagenome TaxID=652676 RepID=A0A3B1DHV2_9ZZZZ